MNLNRTERAKLMNKIPEIEIPTFRSAMYEAYSAAESVGFFAPVNFTALADIIQIQILISKQADILSFEIPEHLHRTLIDLSNSTKSVFSSKIGVNKDKLTIEFESKNSLDKVIQIFEMMQLQNKRAYKAPDLYLGGSEINLDFALSILESIYVEVDDALG